MTPYCGKDIKEEGGKPPSSFMLSIFIDTTILKAIHGGYASSIFNKLHIPVKNNFLHSSILLSISFNKNNSIRSFVYAYYTLIFKNKQQQNTHITRCTSTLFDLHQTIFIEPSGLTYKTPYFTIINSIGFIKKKLSKGGSYMFGRILITKDEKEHFDQAVQDSYLWSNNEKIISLSQNPDFVIELFEQNLEHARHVENERLTYCACFSALIGGGLAVLASLEGSPVSIALSLVFFCCPYSLTF